MHTIIVAEDLTGCRKKVYDTKSSRSEFLCLALLILFLLLFSRIQISLSHPSIFYHIRRLFAYHNLKGKQTLERKVIFMVKIEIVWFYNQYYRRRVGISGNDIGHNTGINHTQSLNTVHFQFGVHYCC